MWNAQFISRLSATLSTARYVEEVVMLAEDI
jgi:hypothetical protein